MEDKWAQVGHKLGECFYCRSTSATYVHIPKNASSFIKSCLIRTNDWIYSENFLTNDHYLVALRDPIERWVSGVAQLLTNNNNQMPFDEIANHVTVDDHTETQTYFLQKVDINKCTFFKVDSELSTTLQQWLNEHDYKIPVSQTLENQGNQDIKKYVKEKVDSDPTFVLKLKQYFKDDYELINRVKFYG